MSNAFDTDILNQDLQEMIDDLPVTATYNSTDYIGTRTSLDREHEYSDFGFDAGFAFAVNFRVSQIGSSIARGDKMTIDGTVYRVLKTHIDDADVNVRVDLGNEYR